jgi:hypothetical protein
MNDECRNGAATGSRRPAIHHSYFCIHHFPSLAKGEIASLAGAADDQKRMMKYE